jgi:pimeloyl-ACP methyl ester carboxylesterase
MHTISTNRFNGNIVENQREILETFESKFPKRTIKINEVEWSYRIGGNGESAMIFFHGGYLDGDMYIHQMLAFGEQYYVLAPTTPASVVNITDIISATLNILEKEGFKEKNLILLGVSFGGIISQVFLENHPQKIRKVILSHTLSQNEEYYRKFRSNLRQFTILPWFILKWLFRRGGAKMAGSWGEKTKWGDLMAVYFSGIMNKMSKELVVNRTKCLVDFWNHTITTKTGEEWNDRILIISSNDDNEMMKNQVEELIGIYPESKIHRFEVGKGGHHTVFYFPEEYNAVVKTFLES